MLLRESRAHLNRVKRMAENSTIDVLLEERRLFKPSEEFVEKTNVKRWMDKHGIKNYDELLEKARDLEWF